MAPTQRELTFDYTCGGGALAAYDANESTPPSTVQFVTALGAPLQTVTVTSLWRA